MQVIFLRVYFANKQMKVLASANFCMECFALFAEKLLKQRRVKFPVSL